MGSHSLSFPLIRFNDRPGDQSILWILCSSFANTVGELSSVSSVFRTYIHGEDALSRAHRRTHTHTHTHEAAMFLVFPRISGEKISACAGVPRRRFPEEISWEVWRAGEYRFQSVWDCVGYAFSLPTLPFARFLPFHSLAPSFLCSDEGGDVDAAG